jgi:hypothetical protein
MPNKKLSDAEIVRVLDLLHKRILKDKFASRVSEGEMLALVEVKDLINRKQAEIERLQKHNTDVAFKHYNDGKAEAIKECIEAVKKLWGNYGGYEFEMKLDNLLKEMVVNYGL